MCSEIDNDTKYVKEKCLTSKGLDLLLFMRPTTSLARSLASSGLQMFARQFMAMADSNGESTEARSYNFWEGKRKKRVLHSIVSPQCYLFEEICRQ